MKEGVNMSEDILNIAHTRVVQFDGSLGEQVSVHHTDRENK
ncbi:hypothetical protein GPLA_3276 [Paraglaciecola polaris LMG 21857]|uniref:Uncharacterized protein n=1 Tax=Paraglaciecola polaris LMG 21857 TaxID=1129793 RepID=K6ZDJ2_9ALTE|nr:hypothetical protein GPLA_3276 [Paraglaciecola polaris LMG 21857]